MISRQEAFRATLEVTRSLLSCSGDEPLTTVAQAMQAVSKSDFVLMILPSGEEKLMVEAAIGDGAEHLAGFTFPRAGSISDRALTRREVVLVENAGGNSENPPLRLLADEIDAGPMMFVPLEGQVACRGVMAVGRRGGATPYEQSDVEPAMAFGNHATLALELADGRHYHQQLQVLEERHRIAAELHDQVLQRLFAMGMTMQSVVQEVGPATAPRIEQLITSADDTISCIRTLIRNLHALDDDRVLD